MNIALFAAVEEEVLNIKLLDRLPIDPEMATLCDKGQIEKVADTHLENVLDVLESLEV